MNLSSLYTSLRVFAWLLWFDVRFLAKDFWANLIDSLMWPIALIVVNGYVLPSLGMADNYGGFVSVSLLVMMGSYTAWTAAAIITADLTGERTIYYDLTLPLPYWMVWIKMALYLALKAGIFCLSSLFLGKLLLASKFSLEHFSLLRFVIVYTLSSLFFGIFALWSTVIVTSVESHSRLDLRLVGPMFFLNGFAASWTIMNGISPILGMLTASTPWIYAYEGTKGAVLGQAGFLPFWLCVGMLLLFSTLFLLMGIKLFKKRMDCV